MKHLLDAVWSCSGIESCFLLSQSSCSVPPVRSKSSRKRSLLTTLSFILTVMATSCVMSSVMFSRKRLKIVGGAIVSLAHPTWSPPMRTAELDTLIQGIQYFDFPFLKAKGVDPDKKVRGTDLCVTQPFPAGGLGGRCERPSGVRGGAPEANAFWNNFFEN